MNSDEFEQFVLKFGKDILRFCRMTAEDTEAGNELYQDTMVRLLKKRGSLDFTQNTKSYALSTSIFLAAKIPVIGRIFQKIGDDVTAGSA